MQLERSIIDKVVEQTHNAPVQLAITSNAKLIRSAMPSRNLARNYSLHVPSTRYSLRNQSERTSKQEMCEMCVSLTTFSFCNEDPG
jgi:hypothetical protein